MNELVNINKYLFDYLLQKKGLLFINCILLIVKPLQKIYIPQYYGKVITNLNSNKDKFFSDVKILIFIYILVQVLYSLTYRIQGLLIPEFTEYSIKNIFSYLLNTKGLDYENLEIGECLAKIMKVPNVIYKYLDLLRVVFFSQFIIFIFAVHHYYKTSKETLGYFLFIIVGLLLLQYISYNLTVDIELKRQKENDKIYQHLQDVLNNLITIVICKQEKFEKKYLHEYLRPFIDIFYKSLNMNFIIRLIFGIFTVVSFVLLNYSLYKNYINKNITKEKFVSSFIVTYSILGLFSEANYMTRSILDIISQVKDVENFFNSKSKYNKNYNEKEHFSNGEIVFKNVSYKYDENDETSYALKNINLTINKNENVALIGQLGSGKSTLVKMILKFIQPTSGELLIHDININIITKNKLYDYVFYIPQKAKLLNRTLYENIIYGLDIPKEDKNKTVQNILSLLRNIKIDKNIIDVFSEKMDKEVGIDGSKLSGGQRQMVWIIRALLRNVNIIILDEPTASMDKKNKEKILNIIKEIGKDKTIIVISHDEISNDFRKIKLDQGKIVEENNNSFDLLNYTSEMFN